MGCSDNVPDNLISKEKMENIIFDIMILNAASGFDLKIGNFCLHFAGSQSGGLFNSARGMNVSTEFRFLF